MEDRFKYELRKSQDKLEEGAPSELVWEKLKSNLGKRSGKVVALAWYKKPLTIAASLLILVLIAGGIFLLNKKESPVMVLRKPGAAVDTAGTKALEETALADENIIRRKANEYSVQVSREEQELLEMSAANPALLGDLEDILQKQTNSFREMKKTLEASPNREKLLEAMLHNLQMQQRIIENQIIIIKAIQNKKPTDEKDIQIL